MFQSIKALEIKTSKVFSLDFANNSLLSCFFFLFLIIDLCLLIPTNVTQMFNPIAELAIPVGVPTKEAKAEMETHPVIEGMETSKSLM